MINQVYDFENDRVNKPTRPSSPARSRWALQFGLAIALYLIAVVPTGWWPRGPRDARQKLDGPLAHLMLRCSFSG